MKFKIFFLLVTILGSKNMFGSTDSVQKNDLHIFIQQLNKETRDKNLDLYEYLDILDTLIICGVNSPLELIEEKEDTRRELLENIENHKLKILQKAEKCMYSRIKSGSLSRNSDSAPAAQSSDAPFKSTGSAPTNVNVLYVNDDQNQQKRSVDEQQKEERRRQELLEETMREQEYVEAEFRRTEALERQRQLDDDYVPQQQNYQYVPQPKVQYHYH